jgi:hypothetical protein
MDTSCELSPGQLRECLGPIWFLCRASIRNNFISENGIVAVFGDENQLVTGDITRTNNLQVQFLGGRSEIEHGRGAEIERGAGFHGCCECGGWWRPTKQ